MEEQTITILASDLSDAAIITSLGALERDKANQPSDEERSKRIDAAGMTLAAEAWRRGLISAYSRPPQVSER